MDFPTDGFAGLVFDLDGTLVDSMPAHFAAWCEALVQVGAAGVFKEEAFYAMGGRPTKDIVLQLNADHGLQLDPEQVALAKKEAFMARLDQVTLHEEVVAYARSWQGRVPMAIATGGSRMVAEKTLAILGLSALFDAVVTADDVAAGKPDPEVFLLAAERIGVDPTKCVAFEDAEPGVISAQRAGMRVVFIPAPTYPV